MCHTAATRAPPRVLSESAENEGLGLSLARVVAVTSVGLLAFNRPIPLPRRFQMRIYNPRGKHEYTNASRVANWLDTEQQ
jgi:hypothetical protein